MNNLTKPITIKDLELHEQDLDDSNLNCYVPIEKLREHFNEKDLKDIFSGRAKQKYCIRYLNLKNPISIGPLNTAFVWSQFLEKVNPQKNIKIVELGPGKSEVIFLALCFWGFRGEFIKIDLNRLKKSRKISPRYLFTEKTIRADIIKNTEAIPEADIIIMNHFLDDLFMDLWANDKKIDYFGKDFNDVQKSSEDWGQAIKEDKRRGKYTKQIIDLVKNLSKKIKIGGHILIKNFPSAFETIFRQVNRVNFCSKLTRKTIGGFQNTGFQMIDIDFSDIIGSKAAKYPNSFFVLKK